MKGNAEISCKSNCCYYFNRPFFSFFSNSRWCVGIKLKYSWQIWASWVHPIYCDICFVLPSAFDIFWYILSCRSIAIYDLPINLRYIYKRVSPLPYIVVRITKLGSVFEAKVSWSTVYYTSDFSAIWISHLQNTETENSTSFLAQTWAGHLGSCITCWYMVPSVFGQFHAWLGVL